MRNGRKSLVVKQPPPQQQLWESRKWLPSWHKTNQEKRRLMPKNIARSPTGRILFLSLNGERLDIFEYLRDNLWERKRYASLKYPTDWFIRLHTFSVKLASEIRSSISTRINQVDHRKIKNSYTSTFIDCGNNKSFDLNDIKRYFSTEI